MSSLPFDPFAPKESQHQSYRYGDNDPEGEPPNHGYGALFAGNAEQVGLRQVNVNEFILIGIGPDQELGIGAGFGDVIRGLPYDSSNGLVSNGDITLRGGGGINQ